MKFVVSREALLRPLQLVAGVVERRQTLPVLSNLLVNVDAGRMTLTGTDLEVELLAEVELEGADSEAGEITLPARKLMEIWRALPEGAQVSFGVDGNRVVLRSGRSRFQLATLPAEDFPGLEEGAGEADLRLGRRQLHYLLERTAFAMAQQDVRYFLNGMLLEAEGAKLRAVATDGHRLALAAVELEHSIEGSSTQVIVPRKGVLELMRLLTDEADEVGLSIGQNHLKAQVGGYRFTTKLVDGKFPEYTKVVPKSSEREIIGDRQALREAFNRTAILSNEKYRGVRLVLDKESLTVQANNPEQEEAEETVSVQFDGEPLEIGFNVSYLQDVLAVLESDQVRICLGDGDSSALLEEPGGSDALYVVMPMRL